MIKSNDRFRRNSPDRNKGKELRRDREKSSSRRLKDIKGSSNNRDDRKSSSRDRTKRPSTDRSKDAKSSDRPKDNSSEKSINRLKSPSSRKRSRSPSSKKRSRSPRSRKRSGSPSSKYQKGCDKSDSDKRRKCDETTQHKNRDTKKEPDLRELILKKKALESQLHKDPGTESMRKPKILEGAKSGLDSNDVMSMKSSDSKVEVVDNKTTMIKVDKIIRQKNPEKVGTELIKRDFVEKKTHPESMEIATLSEVDDKILVMSTKEKLAEHSVQPTVIENSSREANVDVLPVKSEVVKNVKEVIKESKQTDKYQEMTKSSSKLKKKHLPEKEDSAKPANKKIKTNVEKSADKFETGRATAAKINVEISSAVPIEVTKTQERDAKKNVPMPIQRFKIKPAAISHSMTKTTPIESSHVEVKEKTSSEVRMASSSAKKTHVKDQKKDLSVTKQKTDIKSSGLSEIKTSPIESSSISKQLVTVRSQSVNQLLEGVKKCVEEIPDLIQETNVKLSDEPLEKIIPDSAIATQSKNVEVPSTTIETPSPSATNDSLETNCASKENSLNQSQLSEKSDKKRSGYSKDVNADGIVVFTINRANKKKKKHKEKS